MKSLETTHLPPMACHEAELRMLDYLDDCLPPAERRGLEAHLAGCAACQALARGLRQLDAALVSSLKPLTLPADFDARLRQRLEAIQTVSAATNLPERKRALQAEFEGQVAALRRKSAWGLALLDGLGYGVLAGLAAWLLLPLIARWAESGSVLQAATPVTNLLVASAAGALFLLVGLGVAFQQLLKKEVAGRL